MLAKTIAIDGGAGSGKSTIGRLVADTLSYSFLDAGKLYRAITAKLLEMNINPTLQADLIHALEHITITVTHHPKSVSPLISVNQIPIISELHNEAINQAVPIVASYPETRQIVREIQKAFAQDGNIVYSGRDIGTVILPDADLKIYLDVSLEERARRRFADLSDTNITLEEVMTELSERDTKDKTRTHSPLVIAEDAHVLKTDGMEKEEVVRAIGEIAKK